MPISRVRCTTLTDSTLAMPSATLSATKALIICVDRLCERRAFISWPLVSIQLSAFRPVSRAMRAAIVCAVKMSSTVMSIRPRWSRK
jgi:hypothetical protein